MAKHAAPRSSTRNQYMIALTIGVAVLAGIAVFISLTSSQPEDLPEDPPREESDPDKLYADDSGAMILTRSDLREYKQVEANLGQLKWIDTDLVINDAFDDDPTPDMRRQGYLDARLTSGGAWTPTVNGNAHIQSVDSEARTVVLSGFGPTVAQVLDADSLTLNVIEQTLSRGEATIDDVSVDDTIAMSFRYPQDGDRLSGYLWVTDDEGDVVAMTHPETYPGSGAGPA